MTYGQRLRAMRTAAGLTQAALAKLAGISNVYLSDVERGNRHPFPEETTTQIAAACGADPTELMCLAGKVPEDIRKVLFRSPVVMDFLRWIAEQWEEPAAMSAEREAEAGTRLWAVVEAGKPAHTCQISRHDAQDGQGREEEGK